MGQRHTCICPQPGRCSCPWEVSVFDARAGRKIRKTFRRTGQPPRFGAKTRRSHSDKAWGPARALPALGGVRVSELRRTDVQDFVDPMVAAGHNPSTLQGTLLPLPAIYPPRSFAWRRECPVRVFCGPRAVR